MIVQVLDCVSWVYLVAWIDNVWFCDADACKCDESLGFGIDGFTVFG